MQQKVKKTEEQICLCFTRASLAQKNFSANYFANSNSFYKLPLY